jgi:ATP-binding protein involved in chromosome partitioning
MTTVGTPRKKADAESAALTPAFVREALREVAYPGLTRDIVSLGLVGDIQIRESAVQVVLSVSSRNEASREQLMASVHDRLRALGAAGIDVRVRSPETPGARDPWADRGHLPGVRRIVAVGSGKGGVGKSTVAVNLAIALRDRGANVGILDADIYGPSVPMMLGIEDGAKRVRMTEDRVILPLEAHGISLVSFGFFLGPESPAVWRGPMVSKAVRQFSRGVLWSAIDVLVVDLPPGTGDIPLSLAQSVVIDGGIVVTTPQRLAVQEAEKAVGMFRKLEVPVLGVAENMSHAVCACGRRSHPFGRGGGEALAASAGIPLLASVPFQESVPEGGDSGRPVVSEHPASDAAAAFASLAREVEGMLDHRPVGTGG